MKTYLFVVHVGRCPFSHKAEDEAAGSPQPREGHQQQLVANIAFEERRAVASAEQIISMRCS